MELRDEKLDWWLKNCLNVLFIGHAGVGKTARVKQAFERNNLRYKYFSAATMDPFVDFVGVPRVVKDDKGIEYLDYVLPKDMRDGKIEAIFMDELNRSHKKVRNAVMELIQFRTINGRPFPNLKVIWAAINPEDEDEYQVEPLDKAQKGRFEVHVNVPYAPDRAWFAKQYGEHLAKAALDWWHGLPDPQKKEVDPRRLDYALKVYKLPGGDMRDILPQGCNVAKLITTINTGPAIDRLVDFFNNKNQEDAKKYLAIENNYAAALQYLVKTPGGVMNVNDSAWFSFFLPLLPNEKLASLIAAENAICNHMLAEVDRFAIYRRVMQDILAADTNKQLCRRIKRILGDNKTLAQQYGYLDNKHPAPPFFNKDAAAQNWSSTITSLMGKPMDKTPQRVKVYTEMVSLLPPILSAQEAVETLELLNMSAGRCWPRNLPDMRNLTGVWNHCIEQLHKGTGLSWLEILNLHGEKFSKLLEKMVEAKYDSQLYCPLATKSISDLVLERNEAKFKDTVNGEV